MDTSVIYVIILGEHDYGRINFEKEFCVCVCVCVCVIVVVVIVC